MDRVLRATSVIGGVSITAGILSEFFLYDVDAGNRAVIFDKFQGLQEKVVGEGTHFRIPFIQMPIIMDVRSRPKSVKSLTGTKDLQMVSIGLRVLYHPKEDKLTTIYKQLGTDFDERVLPSLIQEVLKAIVAQYNAEELLSQRALVSHGIRAALVERAANFNLVLDDVAITHLSFGHEFAKAIEQKQVAQQDAERQAYVVAKTDQERKAAITLAEGEAEAAALISKAVALAGNGLIEMRRIEAAREVAKTMSSSPNVTYLPSGKGESGGSNLLLNVGKK